MSSTTKAHVTIKLSDVVEAGGVSEAIFEWAKESDTTSSGYLQSAEGPSTFSIQWQDGTKLAGYVARAIESGALHYIDHSDGRMVSAVECDEDDEDAIRDLGGGCSVIGDWSDESVVRVECPSIEDALENPEQVAEMAQSVIDHHGPMSDRTEWKKLIESIREAAEAVEDIDIDGFDAE